MDTFGKELILDMHCCDASRFNRQDIGEFFRILCEEKIDMVRCALHWWDYKDEPEEYEKAPVHLKGTSAVQFIQTSNVTIHTLDVLKKVYLNIFSCKDFDETFAREFAQEWFRGKIVNNGGIGWLILRL